MKILSFVVALTILGLTTAAHAETFGFATNGTSYNLFLFPDSTYTGASGINNSGQIVGVYVDQDYVVHGFLKDGDLYTSLDHPGSIYTSAVGINNVGQIVGVFTNRDGAAAGFLKDGNNFIEITYPNAYFSDAAGINDAGQVIGSYKDSDVTLQGVGWHGYVMDRNGYTRIDYPNSKNSEASGISNSGRIVGYFWDPDGESTRGFLKDGTVYSPFDVPDAAFSSTYPLAINNAGRILVYTPGTSYLKEGNSYTPIRHPFGQFTYAGGMNDGGMIVGSTDIYVNIGIDIKPKVYPNAINPDSPGMIPVAILSAPGFDAPGEAGQGLLSFTFGSTRGQADFVSCDPGGEDVNRDGYVDLVCYFNGRDAAFQCGDTEGFVTGQRLLGFFDDDSPAMESILGYDRVTLNPCGESLPTPQHIRLSDAALYGDFGKNGIWKYNGTPNNWTKVTQDDPEAMTGEDSSLYGDFGKNGIRMWNGTSWSRITG